MLLLGFTCSLSLFTICLCVVYMVLLIGVLAYVIIVSPLCEGWSWIFYLVNDLLPRSVNQARVRVGV